MFPDGYFAYFSAVLQNKSRPEKEENGLGTCKAVKQHKIVKKSQEICAKQWVISSRSQKWAERPHGLATITLNRT